jgi:hypothetical protein
MLISLEMCPQVENTATHKILDFDSNLASFFTESLFLIVFDAGMTFFDSKKCWHVEKMIFYKNKMINSTYFMSLVSQN